MRTHELCFYYPITLCSHRDPCVLIAHTYIQHVLPENLAREAKAQGDD